MSYGRDKVRDMTRSILPSCRGKASREELRTIKKRGRKKVASQLHSMRGEGGIVEDAYWDSEADLGFYPYRRIKYVVRDRREADKIAPIVRWAEARTAHLPREERLGHLAQFVGRDTLAERHAWTHLERSPELELRERHYYGNPYYGKPLDPEAIREAVTAAVNYRHADFNRMLKEGHRYLASGRLQSPRFADCDADHVIRTVGEVDAFVGQLHLQTPFHSSYTHWEAAASFPKCGLNVLTILDRLEIPWT